MSEEVLGYGHIVIRKGVWELRGTPDSWGEVRLGRGLWQTACPAALRIRKGKVTPHREKRWWGISKDINSKRRTTYESENNHGILGGPGGVLQ